MTTRNMLCRVLIDLSGTVHIGDSLTPRCKEALNRLTTSQIPYKFVTNTTKESKKSLVDRLNKLDLDIDPTKIYTSLTSARNYVTARGLRPHLILSDDAMKDFYDVSQEDPNVVVVGLAPEKFNYESLNEAFQYLLNGAQLIAVHKGRYYRRHDDLALGPGPFVAALEYASNTDAVVIGKPASEFFMGALCGDMSCGGDVFMIGDDVVDDVGGAQNVGFKGILVRTGKYKEGDETKVDPPPFNVVDCLADAIDIILEMYQ